MFHQTPPTAARYEIEAPSAVSGALVPSAPRHAAGAPLLPRAPRYAVSVPARVRIGAHLIHVQTIDVSQTGAKLLIDPLSLDAVVASLVAAGTIILINATCLRTPKLATIIWHKDGRIGVKFGEPLAAPEFDCFRRK